jgi:hypothetical protein
MAEIANLMGDMRGIDYAPIRFEVADDLSYWSEEIPGKVVAKAEALTGPTTPLDKRVQTLNPPGSEVGPGTVVTWGSAISDQVDAMGFKWERKVDLASTLHLIGVDHKNKSYIRLVKALEFKLS